MYVSLFKSSNPVDIVGQSEYSNNFYHYLQEAAVNLAGNLNQGLQWDSHSYTEVSSFNPLPFWCSWQILKLKN